VPVDRTTITHAADMAYVGQIHALRVLIDPSWDAKRLEQAFLDTYQATFGNTLKNMPVMLVNLRTIAVGQRTSAELPHSGSVATGAPKVWQRRQVHFNGWYDTPIYQRADLAPGMSFDGPAIVEQSDTTTVVEPGMDVTVDAKGNLLVKVK